MSRKNPSPKSLSKKQPYVAGFILPVILLAAFVPTILFQTQGDVPGDGTFIGDPILPPEAPPAAETPAEREARMLAAFDNPSMVPGQIIVNFEPGTTFEQANEILQALDLYVPDETSCTTPQEVSPDGRSSGNGTPSCFNEYWIPSLAAGIILVSDGEEKEIAKQLMTLPGVVWAEPNYTISVAGNESTPIPTLYENNPTPTANSTATATNFLGIEPIWLVVGVLALGFGAFFAMKK